jgi:hypothetical protein
LQCSSPSYALDQRASHFYFPFTFHTIACTGLFQFITFFRWLIYSFKDEQFSGGGSVTVKGSLEQNVIFSEQLFNGGLYMEDGSVLLFYSVRRSVSFVMSF